VIDPYLFELPALIGVGRSLDEFFGWYDLIVTVAEDPTFEYRLAGHVETGQDSFSDPAMGGLVTEPISI
jgi:phospholipase C